MECRIADLVDMHCHILPGVDDGPATFSESLTLARAIHRAGISTVIATPHFLPGTSWATPAATVRRLVSELQQRLDEAGIGLRVLPGMEIAYHRKLEQRLRDRQLLSLADSGRYLVEPPFRGEHDDCAALLATLQKKGYRLILAHPERIDGYQRQPELLEELVALGVELQVNVGSLLGRFGSACRALAESLRDRGHLHYLASDAHDAGRRAPISAGDWQQLQDLTGSTAWLEHCCCNSAGLIESGRAMHDPPNPRT